MLKSYLISVVVVVGVMSGWAFVQRRWGRIFYPGRPEQDVLSNRISCGKCGCATPCSESGLEDGTAGRVSFESSPSRRVSSQE